MLKFPIRQKEIFINNMTFQQSQTTKVLDYCELFISYKDSSKSCISLIAEGKIMSKESDVAEIFNDPLSQSLTLMEFSKIEILFMILGTFLFH